MKGNGVTPAKEQEKQGTYFKTREQLNMEDKRAVARKVVNEFLEEGDSILLDAGTSSYPIAEEIARKALIQPGDTHYSIMTHNYRAFQSLVEGNTNATPPVLKVPQEAKCNILLTGGRYDEDLNALFGEQTLISYKRFYPKKVLLAVSAIQANVGLYCHGNTEEFPVKKRLFKLPTVRRIIIADYTKFGQPDALCFGKIEKINRNANECFIVTTEPRAEDDDEVKERFERERNLLKSLHIQVVIAERE